MDRMIEERAQPPPYFRRGLCSSCNRDEVIENDNAAKPQIILDSESGIYTVNAGDELTIAPAYRNAEGASYLSDGRRHRGRNHC